MLFNLIAVLGFVGCFAIMAYGAEQGFKKGRSKYLRVTRYNHPYPKYIKA